MVLFDILNISQHSLSNGPRKKELCFFGNSEGQQEFFLPWFWAPKFCHMRICSLKFIIVCRLFASTLVWKANCGAIHFVCLHFMSYCCRILSISNFSNLSSSGSGSETIGLHIPFKLSAYFNPA